MQPLLALFLETNVALIVVLSVMVAGRILFAEKFSPLRTAGILLVAAGVAVVGIGG